ncbi:hypothetical protein JDV02_002366 [Purpureocillium takamizusanense]|uniref:Uncharacterized protein n=1 Tax=Purpureocillium takamizusanense TaxID=2060973 RepID=A0A9Q8QA61_9HYPO|nr:uncharacterized protein JDV02_002366 [Purpureocillium takamizusanense]UNI15880.1 hypothetical protein JDV02_002366 [Purpureocillium takamizusanense]
MAMSQAAHVRHTAKPLRVVSSYDQLTADEATCADDVIDAVQQAMSHYSPATTTSREKLWYSVFYGGWDTSKDLLSPVPVPPLDHQTLAALVGWLNQDLPPSTCALRKNEAKNKAAKKALGKTKAAYEFVETPPKVAVDRRQGRPVYLRARLRPTTNDIDWFWTDANGKGVKLAFIDLEDIDAGEKIDLATAQAWALDVHDTMVEEHARAHNISQATYWIRCRLLRRIDMTTGGQRPPMPTALDFATLEKGRLLWPLALTLPNLSDDVKKRRPRWLADNPSGENPPIV